VFHPQGSAPPVVNSEILRRLPLIGRARRALLHQRALGGLDFALVLRPPEIPHRSAPPLTAAEMVRRSERARWAKGCHRPHAEDGLAVRRVLDRITEIQGDGGVAETNQTPTYLQPVRSSQLSHRV
jgi:hypothetical protein